MFRIKQIADCFLKGKSMARITIEDCLKRIPNRFMLVHVATKRVRQLLDGSPALIKSNNEAVVTALREVSAGKVFVRQEPEGTENL